MAIDHIPHHLSINLDTFGFVEREKNAMGMTVKNRCGRDFLYYALHYYDPQTFSPTGLSPTEIERQRIFGISLPACLVWTGLSFKNIPRLLKERGLSLHINSLPITSYGSFMYAMLFQKPLPFDQAMQQIRTAVDSGHVVGIDVAIRLGGLIDHVLFVYGYDAENFYGFDTKKVSELEYEKVTPATDTRFVMKLPISTIHKRWTRWNRVWVVKKIQY